MNTISQKRMDELLGYVVNETPDDVRQLLRQNGYPNADQLKGNDLSIAFLKQIKDNEVFRNEVADYLTGMVQHETSMGRLNFVSSRGMKGNFNAVTDADPVDSSTTTTNSPSSPSGGTFWQNLGSSQNINSILTSGLNVLSTSLVNKSNKASEERALQAKALDLQIAQTNAAAKATQPQSTGMPGWAWALIILGVAGLVTVVAVTVIKNRKKSKAA